MPRLKGLWYLSSMNCAVVKDLSIISTFSLIIVLRLSNLYLIELIFKDKKMILQGFSFKMFVWIYIDLDSEDLDSHNGSRNFLKLFSR